MVTQPPDLRRPALQPERFEETFRRRQRDGVERPRHETNLSFAARLAEEAGRRPDRLPFAAHLKKD
jgi:hypothetical protein